MKIVVDKDIPFIIGVLEKHMEVAYLQGSKITSKDLSDADALIIRTRTKCNAGLLEGTKVKFIASATIGYDHIDTEYCRANNIFWTNAAGCNSSSVQQYIAAAFFHLAQKMGFQLSNQTVGIVGVGNVGSKVEKLCRALGMGVLLNDPPRERREGKKDFVPLSAVLEHSDIITLHVPLNRSGEDRTYHLAGDKLFPLLKADQILINTSRGEVVDTLAIKSALRHKKLAACVLDVWENEPGIDTQLLALAEIGTPHIAGYSADGKANGTAMSVNSLSRFFDLQITNWYPDKIPVPTESVAEIDCRNMTSQEVMERAVRFTYDINLDDRKLKNSPASFEKQRADYPLRREFPVYTLSLLNAKEEIVLLAKELGFKTVIL